MTIALLTDGFYPFTLGGIQKHSYYLAKYWAKARINVHVYHPNQYNQAELDNYFSKEELSYIKFIYVEHPQCIKLPGHYIYNSYLYSKRLFKEVSYKNYEAIYAQGFTSWYFVKRQKNMNLISNLHGIEMYQKAINTKNKLQHWLLRLAAKPIIKFSVKQISLGGKLTNILYQQGAKKDSVYEVPNAISSEWLKPNRFDAHNVNKPVRYKNTIRRFIFIGRYERRKGIEEINTVLQQLQKEAHTFEFHFIGPIPEEKRVNEVKGSRDKGQGTRDKEQETRCKGKGKRDKEQEAITKIEYQSPLTIHHTPYTSDHTPYTLNPKPYTLNHNPIFYHGSITSQETIKQLLRNSDILVCPSYSEGMPTVILEAMACHCAIIATDVGASGELVGEDNGWLIEGDIVSELKQAMEEAIAIEESDLQQMKGASYKKVKEKYTWDVVAKKTLEVMKKEGERKKV